MSAPATTRAVASLEGRLGVKLFNRTTRLVRLTEPGARFLHDTEKVLEALNEAEAAATGVYNKPKGILKVTAPILFGQKHIMPIVEEYLESNPDVSVKAMFYDRVTNLLEEELDVAIRIGNLKDSSLYASRVGEVRRIVCAAPRYFARKGIPKVPAELSEHDIIYPATFENKTEWEFQNHDNTKSEIVKLSPRLQCNHNMAALNAAIDGFGITRLMSYQVGDEIVKGSLKPILTAYEGAPLPVSIVHVEGRRANAKIRSFIDLAVERLRSNPFINCAE